MTRNSKNEVSGDVTAVDIADIRRILIETTKFTPEELGQTKKMKEGEWDGRCPICNHKWPLYNPGKEANMERYACKCGTEFAVQLIKCNLKIEKRGKKCT